MKRRFTRWACVIEDNTAALAARRQQSTPVVYVLNQYIDNRQVPNELPNRSFMDATSRQIGETRKESSNGQRALQAAEDLA